MLSAAHSRVGQPPVSPNDQPVPVEHSLPPTTARTLASRLNDINVRVPASCPLPKDFGQGALFWRADSMQAPPKLRRIFLPSANDSNHFSKLKAQYGEDATAAYQRARHFAEPFAQKDRGIAQLENHFNPHKLMEIRAQLTKALKQDAQFAEAWILLARTLGRHEDSLTLDGKPLSAKFIQSMAAVMANPYDPGLVMQLMSALPAQENLPEFLKQAAPSGQQLPLSQARLALYMLQHLNPGHAGALSALIQSGDDVKLQQLLPVEGEAGETDISSGELGAMAMIPYDWQTGFLALRHARETAVEDDDVFTPGGGALVTAEQLEILIKLETEERDPNVGPSFDSDSGQALLDRDGARAELLDELADTLDGPDSWFYMPGYMLMNQQQLKAMAGVFRAEMGAFDRLQRVIDAPVPVMHSANDTVNNSAANSDDSSTSSLEVSDGENTQGDAESQASMEVDAPGPTPIYRNTAINAEWVSLHKELIEGRADPALYRQLAEQALLSDSNFTTVLGQSYRAQDLSLRADVLENSQKPAGQQSAVPVFNLYLDQAQEISTHAGRDRLPARIKTSPFVLKLSNQRGYPLVELLRKEIPITWGARTLERDLTDALTAFLRDFDETRTRPFGDLTEAERREDGDFKRALKVVELMAKMPERMQALRETYEQKQAEAEAIATEKGLAISTSVREAEFPDAPVSAAPEKCFSCQESESTDENPLLAMPWSSEGHGECFAQKMVVQGRPDLQGGWRDSPALKFLSWTDQANQAIKGYSDFVRLNRTPTPPPPAPERDSDSEMDDLSEIMSDDESMSFGNPFNLSNHGNPLNPPQIPAPVPLVRQPSPPLDMEGIDQWLAENFGYRPASAEGADSENRGSNSAFNESASASSGSDSNAGANGLAGDQLSVDWGNDEVENHLQQYMPLPDLEAPSDEMQVDQAADMAQEASSDRSENSDNDPDGPSSADRQRAG